MDTVLFTDQGILVFVITGSVAVILSVLGLAQLSRRTLTSNTNWLP